MTGMDPLPITSPDALAILKDAELTGVSVWKCGVTLSFNHGPLTITVENNAEFCAQGRIEVFQQEVIVAFGARALTLIGFQVIEVAAGADKVLTLAFSEGSRMTLRPDRTGHESYSVNFPDGSIFIG